jgi:glycogen(starch) synthase
VIFYPVYLDGNDNLLSLKYYDALQGCHLGVFPSYYEPWGYTPLESAALGVPSVTTDLAGFGRFIRQEKQKLGKKEASGIFILDRMKKTEAEVIAQFSDILYKYAQLRRKDRVEQKMEAKELAELADWKVLIHNYAKAHNMALQRKDA